MVIEGKRKPTNKTQVVIDCGGSGKTLLIIAMTEVALAGGYDVLISSERNSVCDTLLDALVEKLPRLELFEHTPRC